MAGTMAGGKHTKSYAQFSFVSLGTDVKDVNWFTTHSRASRSHAAHWAKSCKQRMPCENQVRVSDRANTTLVFASHQSSLAEKGESSQHHITGARPPYRTPRKPKKKIAKIVSSKREPRRLHDAEHENLGHPFLAGPSVAVLGLSRSNSFLLEFLGPEFIRKFIVSDHEDHLVLIDGSLLLSYAYRMALTGKGSRTGLLELKSKVFHHLGTRIASGSKLSPRVLTAVLALGSPVVCLVSQDLPKHLTLLEYIDTSTQGDCLCSKEFANVAQHAIRERATYLHAMRGLLSLSNSLRYDANSLALLRYICNCMEL